LRVPGRIGGVLYSPSTAKALEFFGGEVPTDIPSLWRKGGKTHVIGLVELYAVAVALQHWRGILAGRRVLLFVDNWPVIDVLIRGSSSVGTWRDLLQCMEDNQCEEPPFLWIARVPSKSNPADGPSRGDAADIASQGAELCRPVCPVSGSMLPSFFRG
jgi:hypothetical protein